MKDNNEQPTHRISHVIASVVVQHLQDECGDGDAHLTISDRTLACEVRDEILRECNWIKDCTYLSQVPDKFMIHLSNMSNENVTITDDPTFEATLPSWYGLRIRYGHWR